MPSSVTRTSMLPLLVAAFLAICRVPHPCHAASTELWATNGAVNAIEHSGNTLYVGGEFTRVGRAIGGFSPLTSAGEAPSGFPRLAGDVLVVIPDGNGGWYVGGEFVLIYEGQIFAHLIRIRSDFSLDASFISSPNGTVMALAREGTTLYVGGLFSTIGGQARSRIAALDASTGTASTWDPGADGDVHSLAVDGTIVYVGGDFSTAGGQARTRLAAIDRTSGLATSWNPGPDQIPFGLYPHNGTLYVAGLFSTIAGQPRNFLAAFDVASGTLTSWNPDANNAAVGLVVSGSSIFVSGVFTTIGGASRTAIAQLDLTTGGATSWSPPAIAGYVRAMSLVGNTLYLGGLFTSIGGESRGSLAAVDATSGALLPWDPVVDDEVYSLQSSSDGVVAGGKFQLLDPVVRNNIAAFNLETGQATSWDPNANDDVIALRVDGSTIYVGGSFTTIGGQTRNRIAAFDLGTGQLTSWNPNADSDISSILSTSGSLFVAGAFATIGGQSRTRLAELSKSTGLATSWDPSPDAAVWSLATDGSTLYVGGNFANIAAQARLKVAAFDVGTGNLTAWDPTCDGDVLDILLADEGVYITGTFTTIGGGGGTARNRLALLDATSGAPLSWNPNLDGGANTLARIDNWIYAAGNFSTVGGQARERFAKIDAVTGIPNSWNPLADGEVTALHVAGQSVYAGGGFSLAAGGAFRGLAVVDGPLSSSVAPSAASGTARDGETLSGADTGTWFGVGAITFERQWLLCNAAGSSCAPITGATGVSYTLTASDVGNTLKVRVTATDAIQSAEADSSLSSVVAPRNTVLPVITGNASVGSALTSSDGTWNGVVGLDFTRQWHRCDGTGMNCAPITGEVASTYLISDADIGSSLRVQVSASANGSAVTSADLSTATAEVSGSAGAYLRAPKVLRNGRNIRISGFKRYPGESVRYTVTAQRYGGGPSRERSTRQQMTRIKGLAPGIWSVSYTVRRQDGTVLQSRSRRVDLRR